MEPGPLGIWCCCPPTDSTCVDSTALAAQATGGQRPALGSTVHNELLRKGVALELLW